jgi:hypothetical protein
MRLPLLLAALAFGPAALAQIAVSPEAPVRGQPVEVVLDTPAEALLVTYRPNSGIAVEETVPVDGTRAVWTPSRAGVVALATPEGATRNVSVRFDETPVGGLLILIGAGLVLFGGATFAMRALLSDDPAAAADDIEHWPDT